MRSSFAILGFVAAAFAQGVTELITPDQPAPPGCLASAPGLYELRNVNATTSSSRLAKRQGGRSDLLPKSEILYKLKGGVVTTTNDTQAYIAANRQFQSDNPPQTGAIYTAGFSLCGNSTLALGGSAIWYQCVSGSISNLYDRSQGKQCSQIFFQFVDVSDREGVSSSSSASSTPSATPSPSSTPVATSSAAVATIADNQPQAPTEAPSSAVSQISDNQPQAATAAPTPSPVYTAGAPALGANLALAGAAVVALAML